MVETGIIGLIIAFILLQQLLASLTGSSTRNRPALSSLGLGLLLQLLLHVPNLFATVTYLEITGLLWVLAGAGDSRNPSHGIGINAPQPS